MKNNSKITVLMPVYNAELYIKESINSVLNQTFPDFELLIIDDGSTDNSARIIESIHDDRIRFIHHSHNYIKSLNIGIKQAKGLYIARMDADDYMHPDRLKIQNNIMDNNPEIIVCGTWVRLFGDQAPRLSINTLKGFIVNPFKYLAVSNFVVHPSVMIRKTFLAENSIYYKNYPYAEDYKMWSDIAKIKGTFYIEPQELLSYRVSAGQISQIKKNEQIKTDVKIKYENLLYLIDGNENIDLLQSLLLNLKELCERQLLRVETMSQLVFEILENSPSNNK